jgi:hypothetical protein
MNKSFGSHSIIILKNLYKQKTPYLHQLQSPGSFVGKNINSSHPIMEAACHLRLIFFISRWPSRPSSPFFVLENRRPCKFVRGILHRVSGELTEFVVGASSAGTNRVTLRGSLSATRIFPRRIADFPSCYLADLLPVRWTFFACSGGVFNC